MHPSKNGFGKRIPKNKALGFIFVEFMNIFAIVLAEGVKRGVLKNFVDFTGKHQCLNCKISLLKKTPTPVFSSEICSVFKEIHFVEHLRTTAPIFSETSSSLKISTSCLLRFFVQFFEIWDLTV